MSTENEQWHNCKIDPLPKDGRRYLVRLEGHQFGPNEEQRIYIASYNSYNSQNNAWYSNENAGVDLTTYITHWHKLPILFPPNE